MKDLFLKSLALTLTLAATSAQANANDSHVQLILDASGSMLQKLPDGQTRIASAKQVLKQFLTGISDKSGLNVGLRIYGAKMVAGDKCKDSKLAVPMQGINKAKLGQLIDSTQPTGSTPIVHSLLEAAKDFPKGASRKLIVLVTDGQESCGGKFAQVTQAFKNLGIKVDVRIIGIDLNKAAKQSFKGFGTLENVRNAAELGKALERATNTHTGNYKIKGPKSAPAGSNIKITWQGPNNQGDYVTIVKRGEKTGVYNKWAYTKNGNPLVIQTPNAPGEYELRYTNEKTSPNPILASYPITLTANKYGFKLPTRLGTADEISVQWRGPNNKGDYITVVPKGAKDGDYLHYVYTNNDHTATLRLPSKAGNYELRYATENTSVNALKNTLYSIPIRVVAHNYQIKSPARAKAGSHITIQYSGGKNNQDYITITPKDAAEGAYTDYFYTKDGKNSLKVPNKAGDYEIRWVNEGGKPVQTLHSVPLKVY